MVKVKKKITNFFLKNKYGNDYNTDGHVYKQWSLYSNMGIQYQERYTGHLFNISRGKKTMKNNEAFPFCTHNKTAVYYPISIK